MTAIEQARENRREAVLASLRPVSAAEVSVWYRRFAETMGGAANEWDDRFVAFIDQHRSAPLWMASAGGGFEFVFSPRDSTGFWLLDAGNGGRGKGLLSEYDAGRIFELAAMKGLPAETGWAAG